MPSPAKYRLRWKRRKGSRYIQGLFTGILKKTDHANNSGMGRDARTADDYEALRYYAAEGGEAHGNIEIELAVFIAQGSAAWIRLHRRGWGHVQPNQAKPEQGEGRGLLAILLANMMESKVYHESGKQ
jgi:hypothetical protein